MILNCSKDFPYNTLRVHDIPFVECIKGTEPFKSPNEFDHVEILFGNIFWNHPVLSLY